MPKGYLAIVLHAHLPFIRHPEFDDFLEEDWLFEAITELPEYYPTRTEASIFKAHARPFQVPL